jgi:hypothetical protein
MFVEAVRPNGFDMTLKPDRAITKPEAIQTNMGKALFQLWGQAHHYQCRWLVLFNTEII